MRGIIATLVIACAWTAPMAKADPIKLYAAGSLRAALTDVARRFAASGGEPVEAKFGASGSLKDEIAGGAKAEVFASANMEHPLALAASGKSGPVVLFARNSLCALVRADLAVMSDTLLDRMLDPAIKLGSSTPKFDPSGDYTFAMFAKADALRPGARKILEGKALQLVGSPMSATPPAGHTAYGWHVMEGRADIFITYCTNVAAAVKENPGQQNVSLPNALNIGADYGLTVLRDASLAAHRFALFVLSSESQRILASHGFTAPTLPQ